MTSASKCSPYSTNKCPNNYLCKNWLVWVDGTTNKKESIPVVCIPPDCWSFVWWPPLDVSSRRGGYLPPLDIPTPRHTTLQKGPGTMRTYPSPWKWHRTRDTNPQKGHRTRDTNPQTGHRTRDTNPQTGHGIKDTHPPVDRKTPVKTLVSPNFLGGR